MTKISGSDAERKAAIRELVGRVAGGFDKGRERVLAAAVTLLCEYALGDEPAAANAVDAEREAQAVARKVVGPLLASRLQRRVDEIDRDGVGKTACRQCAAATESQGRRPRTWAGLSGPLSLNRRYRYCAACRQGWAPSDMVLGLGDSDFTPRLEEVVTMMATTVPHGMAVQLVDEMVGAKVSDKGAQQMVERRAQGVAAQLEEAARAYAPYDGKGLPVEVSSRPVDAKTTVEDVAYLEMDGVVPMTREELKGGELSAADRRKQRRAKQAKARGGRGRRYRLIGREVKNAVLYAGSACAKESASRGCIVDKRYVSHLGDWKGFAAHVWVELQRQNFDHAKKLVVVSDGAEWIRSLCAWLPVPVLLILDLFHVKHRIWEVASALHGQHTDAARRFAETQCARIETGEAKAVIQALRFLSPRRREVRALVETLAEYLTNNLDRMDYPRYQAMGLRVGSGTVESANYHVTGARLKLQGMRWSENGAREMAYLRADLFNGNWAARTRAIAAA